MYLLQSSPDSGGAAAFFIISLLLRIVGAGYCSSKAKELNRSQGGWGFFGFATPILAMIWISFMKPHTSWEENKQ